MSYRNRDDAGCRTNLARLPRAALGLCVIAGIGVLGAARVHGAEAWEILLTHQLKEEKRCTLGKVLSVNEIRVGDRLGLVGRIRCTDAREYDFQREQANQRFDIRLCQPAVC